MTDSLVFSSPHNFAPPVAEERRVRPDLIIQDVTMREGKKASGAGFSPDEKVALARELAEIGLGQIQVGWPGRNRADGETVRAIKRAGVTVPLEVIANVWKDDWRDQLDAAVASQADFVLLTHPASQIRLEWVHHLSRQQVLERTRASVSAAVERGLNVRFSCTDITRTDLDFAVEVYNLAKACGAVRISLSDTVGCAGPAAITYLVRELNAAVGLPVHVHCHNELGLALANTLAAVEAGAGLVDVSVNALGDHGGNTPLDEVAVGLKVIAGVDIGIKLDLLTRLSRRVEALSGVAVPPTKPVVGAEAFARSIPGGDLSKYRPGTNEAYAPELVGQSWHIVGGGGGLH